MRRIILFIGSVLLAVLVIYGCLVFANNRSADIPARAEIDATLEKSITWMERNRDTILDTNNPMLWWMIQQAASRTGDPRLQRLFDSYEQRYLGDYKNIWRPLFYPGTWTAVRFEDIADMPYYNWHFIQAILCDRELGNLPQVAVQNTPGFCDGKRLSPACVTHQLMGLRMMQRAGCGDDEDILTTIGLLQQRIRRQLLLGPRVVDVYMQRVLMLVESGAGELVKPVWIRKLIDAQQDDGSWSAFEPLIPLFGGRHFGYGSRFFAVDRPRSNFHMTAQGVLLFSLLDSPEAGTD